MSRKLFSIVSLFFLISITAFADGIRVTGTVMDTDSQTLPGVAVIEVGTDNSNHTFTDINGKFSLTVKDESSLLLFNYIGYKEVTMKVSKVMEVMMTPDVNELDGVVVIGYGTSKKSDLTGSVASVRLSDIEGDQSTALTGLLVGRIPGVHAVSTGGAPGAKTNIIIRGASSVSGGTAPLYVVDGIMMGGDKNEMSAAGWFGDTELDPLSMINPSDIVSIEVLKDASATAIYGSRGANGVIIVTTKSGSNNQAPTLSFSYDLSVDTRPEKIEMLSGYEYENYMAEMNPFALDTDGQLTSGCARYWNLDGTIKHSGKDNNWQDKILRTALSHNYNLSIRGGGKNINYALSGGYLDKDGIAVGSSFDRLSFSSKINVTLKKWLKAGVDMKGSRTESNGIISATNQLQSNIFAQMLTYNPTLDMDEDSGDSTTDGNDPARNPVANASKTVQNNISNRIQGLGYIELEFIKGLKLRSSIGGYFNNTKSKNYYPSNIGPGQKFNGKIEHAEVSVLNWINENILSYDKTIKSRHNISALLGLTVENTTTDKLKTGTSDLTSEALKEESISFGQLIDVPTNSLMSVSLMSYLARINYGYKDRYLVTASLRADGSSIFPKGNKFSYFPSVAFAWKVSGEEFMKDVKWMDLLKLRLSYGQTGNQRINALSSLAFMNNKYYSFNSESGSSGVVQGMYPATLGNDILKWETTAQYNVGLDLSVLKGRLSFTGDVYYKDTRDLLITEQLPGISGFETAVRNVGQVTNKGIELSLSSVNIDSRAGFKWTTDLNISLNRNRVTDVGTGDRIPITPSNLFMGAFADVFYVREGYPLGAIFGYRSNGLYQLSDFKEFYDADGNFITDPELQKEIYNANVFTLRDGVVVNGFTKPLPGGIKPVKIADNDNPVNPDEDRVYLGSTEPKFYGGFANTFSYKGLSLYIGCNFSYGNKLFNANKHLIEGRTTANISKEYYENCWSIDRQDGTLRAKGDLSGRMPFDLNVEDASYFKIKDITLSYTLPANTFSHIKSARVYVTAHNLCTFTKYSWYDPEYVHPNVLTSALDRYSYPTTLTILTGLSFSF
ncbi:MAG: SusC/RagA family TonB-linked outer membrane protein [Candidatus Cryptobacteroides sp.]